MINILSLGAGVQSSTMALMAARGELGYNVDCAIFADTQAEPKEVYEWLQWLTEQLPFPVYIVTKGSLYDDGLKVHTGKSGRKYTKATVPAFTIDENGKKGISLRHCTADYKIMPIQKKVKELYGRQNVNMLLGISTDEAGRMKPSRKKNITHVYPLIEKSMNRQDCIKWFERHEYPRPPRSACVFCPFHSNREWQRLKTDDPAAFQQAVNYEKELQKVTAETLQTTLYLHRSCKPLDTVQFFDENQTDLFINECEGMCGV